jgi:hypothetical protein
MMEKKSDSKTSIEIIPKGFQCVHCHAKNPYGHKMSCDPPRKLKPIGKKS